jgi:hypothetical protein
MVISVIYGWNLERKKRKKIVPYRRVISLNTAVYLFSLCFCLADRGSIYDWYITFLDDLSNTDHTHTDCMAGVSYFYVFLVSHVIYLMCFVFEM